MLNVGSVGTIVGGILLFCVGALENTDQLNGSKVGDDNGLNDGNNVGPGDGIVVGIGDGPGDGIVVGVGDGIGDGLGDGPGDGIGDGPGDGPGDGLGVALLSVGIRVGLAFLDSILFGFTEILCGLIDGFDVVIVSSFTVIVGIGVCLGRFVTVLFLVCRLGLLVATVSSPVCVGTKVRICFLLDGLMGLDVDNASSLVGVGAMVRICFLFDCLMGLMGLTVDTVSSLVGVGAIVCICFLLDCIIVLGLLVLDGGTISSVVFERLGILLSSSGFGFVFIIVGLSLERIVCLSFVFIAV